MKSDKEIISVFDPRTLPSGAELQQCDIKVEYLVECYLPKQAITILHGPGGIGKTWLAFQIAEAVASGVPFMVPHTNLCKIVGMVRSPMQ